MFGWFTKICMALSGADEDVACTYQVSLEGYWPFTPSTGNGGLGTDSEEKAWETAFRPMGCSSYVNCPMSIARGSDGKYQLGALRVLSLKWGGHKYPAEDQVEGKSGASSRGNSSSTRKHKICCSWKARSWILGRVVGVPGFRVGALAGPSLPARRARGRQKSLVSTRQSYCEQNEAFIAVYVLNKSHGITIKPVGVGLLASSPRVV